MSYIKIPMGNSCSYINFTGPKEFSFKTPSLKWISGKKIIHGNACQSNANCRCTGR